MDNITISERRIRKMIKQLRRGCSPGVDGISAEHLYHGLGTPLSLHLSVLLTLCLRFGCLPDSFCLGQLVPILKKSHLDPSSAASYRPITVSVMMSKLIELYVLDECSDHTPHPCQFGFTEYRGTNTAVTLAHDVAAYCHARGSPIYLCSLDAEGAFDGIPHCILFLKAAAALPDHCWRLLFWWYTRMAVVIKWNGAISPPIPVQRGTRQGGLTSPFLFNLFYEDLVDELSSMNCGIIIRGTRHNVFCYADDVLLASTTPSGLQQLINTAVRVISQQGLRFNPAKTICMTYGKSSFEKAPSWLIQGTKLKQECVMKYLGVELSNDRGGRHANERIRAAQRAFYSLQGAGLHFHGLDVHVAAKLYSVGVRTILTYGCEAIAMSRSNLTKLESTQGKLIKTVLGLRKFSRNSPLLKALNVPLIEKTVAFNSLNLLRSCIRHHSNATCFYSSLLLSPASTSGLNTLVNRCATLVPNLNFIDLVFNNSYLNAMKKSLYSYDCDGLVDSIRILLVDYNEGARSMVQYLVNAF